MTNTSPLPLGSLEAFRRLASPRTWGPGGRWRVAFGGRIVQDDLIAGLRAHPRAVGERFSAKAEAYPILLGCVPWLDSDAIVDAIVEIGCCCVVVDKKGQSAQCERLLHSASAVPQRLLHELEARGPLVEGRPPVIGPSGGVWDRELEPVRVAGWKGQKPLLHAKLAVCCAAYRWEGEMGGWEDHLLPMSVWLGSANWTAQSPQHLEVGAWSTDPQLCAAGLEFLTAVIGISEPFGAGPGGPNPELVEGVWDDAAFAELLAESEMADEETDLM